MAVSRRKSTLGIILVLCFIAFVVMYKRSERIMANVNSGRVIKIDKIIRPEGKETVPITIPPPTKTYFVVPIGEEEEGETEGEEEDGVKEGVKEGEKKGEKEVEKEGVKEDEKGVKQIEKEGEKVNKESVTEGVRESEKEGEKKGATEGVKERKKEVELDGVKERDKEGEKGSVNDLEKEGVKESAKEVLKEGVKEGVKDGVRQADETITKLLFTSTSSEKLRRTTTQVASAIDDEPLACKVPVLDPFHPLVSPLIRDVGTDLRKRCRSMYPRTPAFNVVDNKLVLRPGLVESKISPNSIKLKEIYRDGDFGIFYTKAKKPFLGKKSVRESEEIGKQDFFRLYYDIDGETVSDLYARIAPKVDILEKQIKTAKGFSNQGISLNVLIIGLDSVSRANFERKMGGVISFLKTRMNTYFMEGMSIVGDATTPALIAMLTGKDEAKLPEGRRDFGGRPIDNWPWIMKEYEKRGYMTLFAEDDPGVGAFNLRLEGFSDSPVHHYMRPFWLSLEREKERDEPGLCSKSESMMNLTLKYLDNFFDAYPKARKFAFSFSSYLAHAHPNHLSYAENDLLWFLRTFVNNGYHEDTVVIIMGDHGSRNSEFRNTMQGKLEERLPWFSISVPASFHRRFADLAANLRRNQAIISSPFDVHVTLRHILTYPKLPSDEHTKSLFTKLPRNRTCEDAGIAEHWCPCFKWSPVKVTSEQVQRLALATVDHINKELSKFTSLQTSCHRLSLDSIQDAVFLQANTRVQQFQSTDQDGDRSVSFGERTRDLARYQVIFTTKPNNGKYEATVSVSGAQKLVKVNPEISRINRYNDQPKCIAKEYPHARKFCFCKTKR